MKLQQIGLCAAIVGIVFFGSIACVSLWWTPCDPLKPQLTQINHLPSPTHLFGTDDRGRDILSRIMLGARYSLSISVISTIGALVVGCVLGFIGGYYGGAADSMISFFITMTLAFPSLLLAIGVSSVMNPGYWAILFTLIIISWAGFAKLMRAETLKMKNADHVTASRAMGASGFYIFLRHMAPLSSGVIITAFSLQLGVAILAESSLSFLGFGIQPPLPTWGNMISQGRDYFRSAPWISLIPGIMITMLIICFNVFGETYNQLYKNRFMKRR
ncbi:MAG: ABC transporter permease [bacterium]|nr:ABC transporter permease [bacterium]